MLFLYDLGIYFGYFMIMIIFMVIAILMARTTKHCWGIYAIGAGLQLLSMIGNQKTANFYGTSMAAYWAMYFVLLIIFAVVIAFRRKNV